MTTLTLTPTDRVPAWRSRAGMAGVLYLASWLTALTAMSLEPLKVTVSAGGAAVVAGYDGHLGAATVQNVFSEGVPALALAVVVTALGRGMGGRTRAVVVASGLAAAALSLVQCALGIALTGWAVPGHHASAAGSLFAAFNRLDGGKMFLLAVLAIAASRISSRALRLTGLVLALTLAVSGTAYLLLIAPLAATAYISGPLLLAWVCAQGLTAGRRSAEA